MNESVRKLDGLLLPKMFSEENLNAMRNISLRSNDIILITYPKSGTNWIAYIIWSILNPEEPAPEARRVMADLTPVDMVGLGRWEGCPEDQGRTLVTHMPYYRVSKDKSAKYVVVIRNPLDCCVSFYHFAKVFFGMTRVNDETQEIPTDFFDNFANGTVAYGDFFDHLKSWYAHKDESNIHLVAFEKVKENPSGEILRLAKFLGREKVLEANEGELLNKIVEQSSFTVMKKNVKYLDPRDQTTELPLLRKGEAGSYREALTPKQIETLKDKMERELEGLEILDYWRKF